MSDKVTPREWEAFFSEAFDCFIADQKVKQKIEEGQVSEPYALGQALSKFVTVVEPSEFLKGFAEGLLNANFYDGMEHVRAELAPMLQDSWHVRKLIEALNYEFENRKGEEDE